MPPMSSSVDEVVALPARRALALRGEDAVVVAVVRRRRVFRLELLRTGAGQARAGRALRLAGLDWPVQAIVLALRRDEARRVFEHAVAIAVGLGIVALHVHERQADLHRVELVAADAPGDQFFGTGLGVEDPAGAALDQRNRHRPVVRCRCSARLSIAPSISSECLASYSATKCCRACAVVFAVAGIDNALDERGRAAGPAPSRRRRAAPRPSHRRPPAVSRRPRAWRLRLGRCAGGRRRRLGGVGRKRRRARRGQRDGERRRAAAPPSTPRVAKMLRLHRRFLCCPRDGSAHAARVHRRAPTTATPTATTSPTAMHAATATTATTHAAVAPVGSGAGVGAIAASEGSAAVAAATVAGGVARRATGTCTAPPPRSRPPAPAPPRSALRSRVAAPPAPGRSPAPPRSPAPAPPRSRAASRTAGSRAACCRPFAVLQPAAAERIVAAAELLARLRRLRGRRRRILSALAWSR